MKKLFVIIFALSFLNGCAQTTSMMGPTYTMAKTGSVVQAGSSVATSYGVKQALGQSPSEFITSLSSKQEYKVRECKTFHSSSLSEIFFETLDEINCLRDPFSILK